MEGWREGGKYEYRVELGRQNPSPQIDPCLSTSIIIRI